MMDKFNEMEPKQKAMLVATVVLFIVLGYLVYSTFFKSDTVETTPPPVPSSPAAPTVAASAGATAPQMVKREVVGLKAPVDKQLTPREQAMLKRSKEVEQQYLKLVSEYQIAQLQQKLAQTNAQIAQSRLSTVKALAEAKKLNVQTSQATSVGEVASSTAPKVPAQDVKLIKALYVGKTSGRWMAMLDLDGAYYQVRVGTRLPNGSVVSRINNNGVVIHHDGQRYYLAIPTHIDK